MREYVCVDCGVLEVTPSALGRLPLRCDPCRVIERKKRDARRQARRPLRTYSVEPYTSPLRDLQ